MLFAPLVSTVSIRSFRRVGQRVGQVLGFWWLAHLGVQRTGEIMQSQLEHYTTQQQDR